MRALMIVAVLSALVLVAYVIALREERLNSIERQLELAKKERVLALFREARHYGAGDARLAKMLGKVPADTVLKLVPISRADGVREADQPASMLDFISVAQQLMFTKESPNLGLFGASIYFTDYVVATTEKGSLVRGRAMRLRTELGKAVRKLRPFPVKEGLLTWVSVPEGQFKMGSSHGLKDERPVHEVIISRPFEMTDSEVTVAQWNRFDQIANEPDSTLPKVKVSWLDAYAFAAWAGGRLPTEAEWEYACRAGSSTKYSSGDLVEDLERVGWYEYNSGDHAHEVEQKAPNDWGLYDMHGNLREWVADVQHGYLPDPQSDPWPPPFGDWRVVRGGSFEGTATEARSAGRYIWFAAVGGNRIGFRVVRPARSEP